MVTVKVYAKNLSDAKVKVKKQYPDSVVVHIFVPEQIPFTVMPRPKRKKGKK